MLKRLRIIVLLYVLAFVAVGQWLTAKRSTAWDATLWVDLYPVNGDGSTATQRYLDSLTAEEFNGLEPFFTAEARRYGLQVPRPFRIDVRAQYTAALPQLESSSPVATLWWSLRMRFTAAALRWHATGPNGDILMFVVYHDGAGNAVLDRSTALRKGLIAVANVFADRAARGSNQVVLAHELLHTLGATDKYSPGSNAPRFPEGFADAGAVPRLPQSKAELMAGRIPLDEQHAVTPESLRQVVIGSLTATEIGWRR